MNPKDMTPEQLNNELKNADLADKEHLQREQREIISSIMKHIENERKKLMVKAPKQYTQKCIAEKAGIVHATYKSYLYGKSASIPLIAFLNLVDALGIDWPPILNLLHSPDNE